MSRTTVNLDPSVLRALKARAREEGKSLGQVISEIAGTVLAEGQRPADPPAFQWRTGTMGPPRVDLEDKEAVRRALDGA